MGASAFIKEVNGIKCVNMEDDIEKYVITPSGRDCNTDNDYVRLLGDIRGCRSDYGETYKETTRAYLSNDDNIGIEIFMQLSMNRFAKKDDYYEENDNRLFYYDYPEYYKEGEFLKYKYCYIFCEDNDGTLLDKQVIFKFIEKFEGELNKNGVTVEVYCKNNKGFIKLYRE